MMRGDNWGVDVAENSPDCGIADETDVGGVFESRSACFEQRHQQWHRMPQQRQSEWRASVEQIVFATVYDCLNSLSDDRSVGRSAW